MQDPEFNKYVNNILSDESNKMGVPESVKTAFRNAQTGKLKPNEASTLATIAQDYSERKKAAEESDFKRMQTALAYAQAQGVLAKASAVKPGQVMTQEEFLKLDPALEARGKPIGDGSGRILVESMSNRAPEKKKISSQVAGGEVIYFDESTGEITRREPIIPVGFERVPGASAQPATVSGSATMPAPASLGQFMSAGSMAPDQMGLPGSQGRAGMQPAAAPSPAAIAAIKAVQAAQGAPRLSAAQPVVPAAGGAVVRATSGIRPVPGSQPAIEAEKAAKAEAKARETLQGNIDTTMNTIKSIEKKASKYSVGAPGVTNLARAAGKFFNMADSADVEGLLKTLEGNIAFDALRNLKDSGTSLGQIAIKELDLLKASRGSLEQSLSYPLFMENLNRFKIQTEYASKKLKVLNSALEKGLNEPTKDFYELDKQQNAALKALEKTPEQRLKDMGFTIKSRS
jgi:hypothetical protein